MMYSIWSARTFMFAAAATGGDVTVKNVIPKHLEATTAKLEEIGCEVQEFDDAVRVRAVGRLHRTHVKTLPYPGYPTDMQPQIAVTLALAEGTSIVTESIFENRFKYADLATAFPLRLILLSVNTTYFPESKTQERAKGKLLITHLSSTA